MPRILLALIAISLAAPGCSDDGPLTDSGFTANGDSFTDYVDAGGNISRPEMFREDWVHLGSWFVKQDDEASGPGVHDVYTTRETVQAFRQEGQWPDGAVIVKTVSGIEEKRLTTGNAQWAGEIGVWFVMVRDRKNRFPDNKAWGEGWGWALFEADDPDKNLTSNWRGKGFNNCFGCHAPAKDTEWVYI
ncbi:MAG: cytochrome P460 family protein, partial [Pseudohongiellaceae bacterium]